MNYNTQNAKIASITEKTLVVGIVVGRSMEKKVERHGKKMLKTLAIKVAARDANTCCFRKIM